jgi:hypothetical protein
MQPIPPLRDILGPTPWVLVGGLALRAYIPERMTLDVDILIHERDGETVRKALIAAGYQMLGRLSIGGFSVQLPDPGSQPLDVLTRADHWLDAAPAYDPAGYPVLPRTFLILLKLQAGRTQDLADVQRLVAFTSPAERAEITQTVQSESPDFVEDLEALFSLADLEFGTQSESA